MDPFYAYRILIIGTMLVMAFLLLVLGLNGCTTITSSASTSPDGTKILNQQVTVFAGGKLDDGMLDFRAEASDREWQVESGTSASQADSPNMVRDMTRLIEVLAGVWAMQMQQAPSPPPESEPETQTNFGGIVNGIRRPTTD
jgi:hypothetical protein